MPPKRATKKGKKPSKTQNAKVSWSLLLILISEIAVLFIILDLSILQAQNSVQLNQIDPMNEEVLSEEANYAQPPSQVPEESSGGLNNAIRRQSPSPMHEASSVESVNNQPITNWAANETASDLNSSTDQPVRASTPIRRLNRTLKRLRNEDDEDDEAVKKLRKVGIVYD